MQKREFVYQARAGRVVFGPGSLQHLEREVLQLGSERALILCSPEQKETGEAIAARLGARAAAVFDRAVMHVPLELAKEARALARELNADCAIAVGGGSTIGLGKAIALESDLPILAVPTTYAGSEMTPIYGITDAGLKKTGTDLRVLPKTVIYDADLTMSLPVALSVTSGINAIAHAAEALYSRDENPVTSLMAEEGIAALARALPLIVANSHNVEARAEAQYGAWLCGTVLGSVGMALHHKLCHTLGGSFNLPHAQTHTIVLPHALAYNRQAAPNAMQRIARALGSQDAALGVYELAKRCGAPLALKDIGMSAEDVSKAADIASSNPYWNPREIERDALLALLQDAFDGVAPRGATTTQSE
ncbi:maleylacetate reductase [Paraburkholderia graminis]|jgi:maleylacetate reductase|uniref:maleylacetate reductase n=1 Tax=Paraburkholderia TaxID=1822464 RepID=UPI0006B3F191|nr:maleylacetate reductase [Paraburkholderia graminis]ALE59173.1 Maleylacetate reductase [Burkholderia sp. HB1]AXF11174.1 maleylacetate reductase [Paraburkholderia graminis]MDR6471835.1 maleylacetate reductase [Paraburkholderia graminis]CAB3708147.1 Maleylacetate reductase [Paraburkholderia graminis C4D1M]